MATRDEVVRLILETKGAAGAVELQTKLDMVKGSISALNDSYAAGDVTITDYSKHVASLVRQETELGKQVEIAQRQLNGWTAEIAAANAQLAGMVGNVTQVDVSMQKANQQLGSMTNNLSGVDLAVHQANQQLGSMVGNVTQTDVSLQRANQQLNSFLIPLDAVDFAMDDLAASSVRAAQGVGKTSSAASSASPKMSVLAQRIQAGSYAFQDFTGTSGDLGAKLNSVANNIPQLFAGMGQLGIAVMVASSAAIALYRNWRSVSSLWETRTVVKHTDDLKGWENQLKNNKKSLEELEKVIRTETGDLIGNSTELERYNRLSKEQLELEKKITEEKKKHDLDQLMESKSKADTERGQTFDDASAGRVGQLRDDIIKATNIVADDEIKKYKRGMDDRLQKQMLAGTLTQGIIDSEKEALASYSKTVKTGIPELANQLILDLHAGKEIAVKKLHNLMDAGTGVLIGGNGFRKAFDEGTPEAKKAKEKADKAKADNGGVMPFDDDLKLQIQVAEKAEKAEMAANQKRVKDAEREQKAADKLAGKKDKKELADEKAFDDAADKTRNKLIKDGAKKLTDESGKAYAAEYEQAMVANNLGLANGVPTARNAQDEEAYQANGQQYTLPPKVLENRMKQAMFKDFQSRDDSALSGDIAMKASQGVADSAQSDFMKRTSQLGGQNLNLTGRLTNISQQLAGEQASQGQHINMLMQKVGQVEQQIQGRKRNGLRHGR